MLLIRLTIQTPVGPMLALASDEALCALEFAAEPASSLFGEPHPRSTASRAGRGRLSRLEARLDRWFVPYRIEDGSNDVLNRTREWLAAYFDGEQREIPTTLDMRGQTFELRVWRTLREIPAGRTSTYGALAKQLGSPGASRAVGLANGANPIAIIVPCHRVIGSNGTLTGYGGGLDKKQWLLDHEKRWSPERQLALELPGF
jgi:O-6-methylguanine DNA methyltransferase